MKIISRESFDNNGFYQLQDLSFLNKQRKAGKIAVKTLNYLEILVKNKTNYSLIELNNIADNIITQEGGIPTFKGYKGFPAAVCISVNEQLVHGIPGDYKLQEGDVVTFDLGVTCDGAIADTAITCIYGYPKYDWHIKLLSATKEALDKGIKAIAVGKRIGVIGDAIYKSAKGNSFRVIEKYGGHAVSCDKNGNGILHAAPFISNKDDVSNGFRIQPGLILCLEPMLGVGDTSTVVDKDGWTVNTKSIFAHEEHTVFVHSDHVEIITDRGCNL
jgi:methionyl aminopeptidase